MTPQSSTLVFSRNSKWKYYLAWPAALHSIHSIVASRGLSYLRRFPFPVSCGPLSLDLWAVNGIAPAVSGEGFYISSLHPACTMAWASWPAASGQWPVFQLELCTQSLGALGVPPTTASRSPHDRLSAGGLKAQVAYQLSPQWGFGEEMEIREQVLLESYCGCAASLQTISP